MGYRPQHLARGVAKTTPNYEGRHRLDSRDQPSQPAAQLDSPTELKTAGHPTDAWVIEPGETQ